MSNAMELVSRNKYTVAVRQDIARLQAQLADQRRIQQQTHDQLHTHLTTHNHHQHHEDIGQSTSAVKRSKIIGQCKHMTDNFSRGCPHRKPLAHCPHPPANQIAVLELP